MNLFRVLVTLVSLSLAACSTTITPTQDIPQDVRASLAVVETSASVKDGIEAPKDLAPRLEKAVTSILKTKDVKGDKPVRLALSVERFDIASFAARFLVGAFAGSNEMEVSVTVLDQQTGTVIGRYQVTRSANPGGFGAFMDQEETTIAASAEGIVDAIYPPPPQSN